MLTQLPAEIIAQIIEYLSKEGARSIALACRVLMEHAYRRLYRVIRIFVENGNIIPYHAELVLFHPHLLRYASSLLILPSRRSPLSIRLRAHRENSPTSVDHLCSHLVTMYRLTSIMLYFAAGNHTAVLSALEGLDPARRIMLDFNFDPMIEAYTIILDNPLPVQSIYLPMHESGYQLGNKLLHKCSQSISRLGLLLHSTAIPDFPFLPHLRSFSLYLTGNSDRDLTPWLPFFIQHPSLTSVSLDCRFKSVSPVPLALLPNLRSIKAHPPIIQWLILGRPVHHADIQFYSSSSSNINTTFHSLPLSHGPITTLDIDSSVFLSPDTLVDMIHSLPMLRILKLSTVYQVRPQLKDRCLLTDFKQFPFVVESILQAFGRCKHVQRIQLRFRITDPIPDQTKYFWSIADLVDMIVTMQESGAGDLWRFEIEGYFIAWEEKGTVERIGWLDVASQPKLKGEWKICLGNHNVVRY